MSQIGTLTNAEGHLHGNCNSTIIKYNKSSEFQGNGIRVLWRWLG